MQSERHASGPAATLEFHASPAKAIISAGVGLFLAWMTLVVLMPQAERFTWGWWAYIGIGLIAAWLLWEGVRRLVAPTRLAFSPAGVTQTIWPFEKTLAWHQVRQIAVNEARGMQMLIIEAHPPARSLSSSGWNKTPYEIQAEIHEARTGWAGGVAADHAPPKDVVPPRLAEDRNRHRRIGMAGVVAGAVLSMLGAGNIRMMGPHERQPGVDFQWASPPTAVGGALMVVGLVLVAFGFWRWLWPTGRPASPPLFSTLAEHFVFGVGSIAFGVFGWLLVIWMQHPV